MAGMPTAVLLVVSVPVFLASVPSAPPGGDHGDGLRGVEPRIAEAGVPVADRAGVGLPRGDALGDVAGGGLQVEPAGGAARRGDGLLEVTDLAHERLHEAGLVPLRSGDGV